MSVRYANTANGTYWHGYSIGPLTNPDPLATILGNSTQNSEAQENTVSVDDNNAVVSFINRSTQLISFRTEDPITKIDVITKAADIGFGEESGASTQYLYIWNAVTESWLALDSDPTIDTKVTMSGSVVADYDNYADSNGDVWILITAGSSGSHGLHLYFASVDIDESAPDPGGAFNGKLLLLQDLSLL